MSTPIAISSRVLIIDDNVAIHDDFLRILSTPKLTDDLDAEAAALLGPTPELQRSSGNKGVEFRLEFASQGEQGRDKVADARAANQPFALAFVDMRMPPGWDGLTTICKIWEVDPNVHIVICTAHSERSWDEIASTLPAQDQWAVLKKPFGKIEVLQFAHVMTAKWRLMTGATETPRLMANGAGVRS